MKIESKVAEATKYSPDALEAFYTAVENGQARLALLILVDVIEVFADKLDEFDELKASLTKKVEEVKPEPQVIVEETKPAKQEDIVEPKLKPKAKEDTTA